MRSEMEKLLATGMGAVLLTRSKIETVVRKRLEESRLNREEADTLVEELYQAGENQWSVMRDLLRRALNDTRSALNIGSRQTLEQIGERVDSLEKRLSMVEDLCRRLKEQGQRDSTPKGSNEDTGQA